jgi:Protein of unknown function (DUF3089)
MTQYGTWVSFGGDARMWLAIALLAVAVGVAPAGILLRLPTGLNVASNLLAFATALTLFLPERPAREQASAPESNEQAHRGSPPLPVDSAAFASHFRPAGRAAASRVHSRARRRLVTSAVGAALVLGLAAGCAPAAAPARAPAQAAAPAFVCQPGQAADPCVSSLTVSAVTAAGSVTPTTWPQSAAASKFACFYVYPTASLARSANAGMAVTKLETHVTNQQTAAFSRVCDVWAPQYREQTLPTVLKGLTGDQSLMRSSFITAYDSVLPAWQWFLAHTGGKPIILIGDSQGAAILIHLISAEVDHEPSVLRRLLVAILVGGNLQVPSGKLVGSTFTNVPLCTSATQTGCAIAFSSFPSEPPADSFFGRPGQGTSLQGLQTAKAGQQVACVNPAALSGGTGDLDPYIQTNTAIGLKEPVHTTWVSYPELYSATCEHGGGASWLQIKSLAGTGDTRPVVSEYGVNATDTGQAWGYHGYEYGLALGNLLQDVANEEAAWQPSH